MAADGGFGMGGRTVSAPVVAPVVSFRSPSRAGGAFNGSRSVSVAGGLSTDPASAEEATRRRLLSASMAAAGGPWSDLGRVVSAQRTRGQFKSPWSSSSDFNRSQRSGMDLGSAMLTSGSEERPLLPGKATGSGRFTRDMTVTDDDTLGSAAGAGGGRLSRELRRSMTVLNSVAFLASLGFSIFLPSLWPHVLAMGLGKSYYGFLLAAYCAGQIVGSLVLGYLTRHGFRRVLLASLLLEAAGHALYVTCNTGALVLAARLVAGVGAGSTPVARAYVASNTSGMARAAYLGRLTGVQALGFVAGPAIAAVAGLWKVDAGAYPLRLDMFTVPGYISGILALLNFCAVFTWFCDPRPTAMDTDPEAGGGPSVSVSASTSTAGPAGVSSRSSSSSGGRGGGDSAGGGSGRVHGGWAAVLLCCGIFFVDLFTFSLGETVLVPVARNFYGWDVTKTGLAFACISFVAVITFAQVGKILRVMGSPQNQLVCALGMGVACLLVMMPWEDRIYANSAAPAGSLRPVLGAGIAVPWWRLVGGMSLLLGFAHPCAMVAIMMMYARLVPPPLQGFYMGVLQIGGALGRVVGPIVGAHMLAFITDNVACGTFWLFCGTACLMVLTIVVFQCMRGRVTPPTAL